MSRYKRLFDDLRKRKENALMPFVVVGDPDYNTSVNIIKALIDSGADILELGLPFSDPIADGQTIQGADIRALNKKINPGKIFNLIKQVREYSNIPIGLLVYANLILQRGIGKFYADAAKAGIDSVLVADLPIEEADEYIKAAKKHKVDTVFIVSPLTSNERLKKIIKKTRGFVYVVSRLGVTGARADLQEGTLRLLRRIRPRTKLPLCVGFGISRPEHVKAVCKAGANGAIVGSAVVKIIEKNLGNKKAMLKKIEDYIELMKDGTKNN